MTDKVIVNRQERKTKKEFAYRSEDGTYAAIENVHDVGMFTRKVVAWGGMIAAYKIPSILHALSNEHSGLCTLIKKDKPDGKWIQVSITTIIEEVKE